MNVAASIWRDPLAFLLLIPLTVLIWRVWRMIRQGKYAARIPLSSVSLWKKNIQSGPSKYRFVLNLIYALAAVLCIVALARPVLRHSKTRQTTEGVDIVLILDMSASMRVEDFRDRDRMDVAKSVMRDFINGRANDRIGLVAFSGEPVSLAPPTLDYSLVLQQLKNIEIGDLKDGTAIGDGLALGVARLARSKSKSKVIILVTDGDNNMGQIDPMTAGELAKGYGIKVYSIAIGTEGRVKMPFIQKDLFGRSYKTYQYFENSINPALLEKISASTGGVFYRVEEDVKTFRNVFSEIDRLERTKIDSKQQILYDEKFEFWARSAAIFLLIGMLLSRTALRVYP